MRAGLVGVIDVGSAFDKCALLLLVCFIQPLQDLVACKPRILVLVGSWTWGSRFICVLFCFAQELEWIFLVSICDHGLVIHSVGTTSLVCLFTCTRLSRWTL